MISEVDVAKKCYQIWHKVAKVPKKCYQMWQNVAKGVPRGFKGPQVVSRGSNGKCYQRRQKMPKGFQGKVLPDVAKKRQRGSKGKCYQMWQKVAKGVPKDVQGRPTLFAKLQGRALS